MSEEKKEKEIPIVMIDGIPCINLDTPGFPKAVKKFFPFSQIQGDKQKYFAKVLEELQKRNPISKNIVPFDIFIVDLKPIKKEKEDDCESE